MGTFCEAFGSPKIKAPSSKANVLRKPLTKDSKDQQNL